MNISNMIKPAAAWLILSVVATSAFAGGQKVEQVVVPPPPGYAYVWVTGSRIPQRVKISPVGTTTFNSLSVWDRRQINQTGRQTTEGVLAQDPSVRVIMGHGPGM
jgi:hypothetical protein